MWACGRFERQEHFGDCRYILKWRFDLVRPSVTTEYLNINKGAAGRISGQLLSVTSLTTSLYICFFLYVYFCLSTLNQQHRLERLPACEDNYALCSELIPMGRALLVSLRHSWSQHVHLQLSCSVWFNHRTFASLSHEFPIHLGARHMWIYACIVFIYRTCMYIKCFGYTSKSIATMSAQLTSLWAISRWTLNHNPHKHVNKSWSGLCALHTTSLPFG